MGVIKKKDHKRRGEKGRKKKIYNKREKMMSISNSGPRARLWNKDAILEDDGGPFESSFLETAEELQEVLLFSSADTFHTTPPVDVSFEVHKRSWILSV